MSAQQQPHTQMPLPGEKAAPKWNGKEKELMEFLRSFETAATRAGLSSQDKCIQLGRYCKHAEDQDLLESLDSFKATAKDWNAYKQEILRLFPGADPETKYSMESLERLVRKTHKKSPFRKVAPFAKYNRRFQKQATWLINKQILTDEEKVRLYLKGFPTATQEKIEKRLEITDNLNDDPRKKRSFVEVQEAIQYIVKKIQIQGSDDSSDSDSDIDSSGSDQKSDSSDDETDDEDSRRRQQKHKKKKSSSRPIKQETSEVKIKSEPNPELYDLLLKMNTTHESSSRDMAKTVETVSTLISSLSQTISQITAPQPTRSTFNNRTNGINNANPNQKNRCNFCWESDGHYLRNCPSRQDYEQKNYVKRDSDNRLIMHTGERIPNFPANASLKARIDAYMKRMATMYSSGPWNQATTSNPTTTALMIETVFEQSPSPNKSYCVSVSPDMPENDIFEDSEKELLELVAAIEAESKTKPIRNQHPMVTRSCAKDSKPEGAINSDLETETRPRATITQVLPEEHPITQLNEPNRPIDEKSKQIQAPISSNNTSPIRYTMKSSAEDPLLMNSTLEMLKKGTLSSITPEHILSVSPFLRAQMINYLRTQKVEVHHLLNTSAILQQSPLIVGLKSLPLREVDILLQGGITERAVLDDGSSIVVMRKDLWEKIPNARLIQDEAVTMECADSSLNQTMGMVQDLPIKVGHITFFVQAHVVPKAPYQILLGQTFSALAICAKHEFRDGSTLVTLSDPNNPRHIETVPTFPRIPSSAPPSESFMLNTSPSPIPSLFADIGILQDPTLRSLFPMKQRDSNEEVTLLEDYKKRYKPVNKRSKPVPTTLPAEFKVVRNMPHNPLDSLPEVNLHPQPSFDPGKRLTEERWDKIQNELENRGFLTLMEIHILREILKMHEDALAWNESMRGTFNPEYFPPIIMPVIEHIPWVEKNLPIPAGLRAEVIRMIKEKIDSGTYELSNSSYRSRFFVVPKKQPGALRIVHDLQPLNRVTIKDAGVPPIMDEIIEETCGRQIYSVLDALVGYDHQLINEQSRDLTTFQSPLGLLRLTVLPMGWTNSVSVFHGHITFILQDEIPEKARPFIDDIACQGPRTKYPDPSGKPARIPEDLEVQKFVFEHLQDLNRILHRLRLAGVTISAKKLSLCVPEVTILGHRCTQEGRIPDDTHVRKVLHWPDCRNLTEVRGFLGVSNLMRIFVKDYAKRADALQQLTRKGEKFRWGEEQINAFKDIKHAITSAPVLKPMDYKSNRPVYLSVDSSVIAVGWLLAQEGEDGKRHPVRYGSRVWKAHESKYSQAKLELYGLLNALKANRPYIIGIKKLIVEVDAEYIKGMINNPDLNPNATLNRWIATIKLFDFDLKHVPATIHTGPDGMSRKPPTIEDIQEAESDDIEEWIDEKLESFLYDDIQFTHCKTYSTTDFTIPITKKSEQEYHDLDAIKKFLETLKFNNSTSSEEVIRLSQKASRFFINNNKLYKRDPQGRHLRVITKEDRISVLTQVHDGLGHKGFHPCRSILSSRFWWPNIMEDLKWFLRTCQKCQERNTFKLHIPPIIPEPATLFARMHLDTMFMPKARGFRYIIHGVCSISGWPEAKALARENEKSIGEFIFNNILCHYGAIHEIITDNGKPFIKALEYLAKKYHINHIRISPYNSQAQGIVERAHFGLRESLIKACDSKISDWPIKLPYALWAQRITTRRSTGHSPYYMVHGVEPVFPFDIEEATFLAPQLSILTDTDTLIAHRIRQLEKRSEDIESMKQQVWKWRRQRAGEFEEKNKNIIKDFHFNPGTLVLVRNSADESGLKNKYFPRYFGPFVVVKQTKGGSYTLAEMDGTISKLRFAAKRIVPYHLRSRISLPSANNILDNANKQDTLT